MSPFLILLIVCTIAAIIYWFKNASSHQGVTALKLFFVITGLFIVILIATGRLPLVSSIPLILLGIFKSFALQRLLIPFIRLLTGNYKTTKITEKTPKMNDDLAIEILGLTKNPSREEIVQAHRQKMRELNSENNASSFEIMKLNLAREHLINQK